MGYFYNKLRDLAQTQGINFQEIDKVVREGSAVCDVPSENTAQALYLTLKAYSNFSDSMKQLQASAGQSSEQLSELQGAILDMAKQEKQ